MTVDMRALRAEFRALDEKAARDLVETIIDVYKAERSRKNTLAVVEFDIGQKVSFKGKRGIMWTGVIRKVNRTTVTVLATSNDPFDNKEHKVLWRVHPTSLKVVA
mgnify:CR=1 FL=1